MESNSKAYHDLFRLYKSTYSEKTAAKAQADFNLLWKEKIKPSEKGKINFDAYNEVSTELKEKKNKKDVGIRSFFSKKTPTKAVIPVQESVEEKEMQALESNFIATEDQNQNVVNYEDVEKDVEPACPVQDKLKSEIAIKNDIILRLIESRNVVCDLDAAALISKKISAAKDEKEELEKKLRRKISDQRSKKKQRRNEKENLENLKINHPELATLLKRRDVVGKPQIECDQPGILQDILKIAAIGAACGDRRRDDIFRTVKTLDDLHKAISSLGYKISRTALYLRLLPRNSNTREGKRHVNSVNVKLIRPQNNLRKGHPDRMFAAESFKAVDDIAGFLGSGAAVYISQDDKSSVPLGVVAAKRQSAILMNMRLRLRLPDHDFKVGSRHLLTPSVIAVCNIDPKLGVTYSGPTYVAVRSAKHNGSTAHTHNEDLKRFVDIQGDVFRKEGSESEFKPVWLKGVDGGPDENPRFEKNIIMGCKTFRDFDLDCLIEVTNAPGLSAYNRAERRMYPLSKELTGVVLPYDKFGSHLDASGKTIDEELEVRNFQAAGEVLANIWDEMEIDGHKVTAEFIQKKVSMETSGFKVSPMFRNKHVLETQYMTVFLKCDDRSCCSPSKTMVESFFPHKRIPALIPIQYSAAGPVPLELEKDIFKKEFGFPDIFARVVLEEKLAPKALVDKYSGKVPYDAYFPTIQGAVQDRTCVNCKKYHASKKSLKLHMKVCPEAKGRNKNLTKSKQKKQRLEVSYFDTDTEEIDELEEDCEAFHARDQVEIIDNDVEITDDEEELDGDSIREMVGEEPAIRVSAPTTGIFEHILDLKEWLKHAWTEA